MASISDLEFIYNGFLPGSPIPFIPLPPQITIVQTPFFFWLYS